MSRGCPQYIASGQLATLPGDFGSPDADIDVVSSGRYSASFEMKSFVQFVADQFAPTWTGIKKRHRLFTGMINNVIFGKLKMSDKKDSDSTLAYQLGTWVSRNPKWAGAMLLAVVALFAYSYYDKWAKEELAKQVALAANLGFDSVDEMKTLKSKGFNTKGEYNDAEAKKLGFDDDAHKKKMNALGITNRQELEQAIQKMNELGFESLQEMKELQAAGFKTKADKIAHDKEREAKRMAEERACQNSASCLMNKVELSAATACSFGADNYLRQIAKYNFKWDDIGWLEAKFDSYLTQVKAPGVVTLITNKVSLQNGFGAYQRIKIYCDYDVNKNKVTGYFN